MVRYADDLVLFFRNKEDALDGRKYLKLLLATFELSIPEIATDSKTKIISRSDPLDFLGREIVHLGGSALSSRGLVNAKLIKSRISSLANFHLTID